MPKMDEIKLLLNSKCTVNILGLCETFLDSSVSNDLLHIDGFEFERKDRDGRSGGGILMYIANDINYKRRCDIESGIIETIWTEIQIKNSKPLLLCSAYSPPPPPPLPLLPGSNSLPRK